MTPPTVEQATEPRVSPLHTRHEALGASFTDFGGSLMPVRYTSDLEEHHAVRNAAGLFDISHMAEFLIIGPGAGAYLDAALASRLSTLRPGKAKYSLVLTEHGGILDDVIVYCLTETRYLIIANAGNRGHVARALGQRSAESGTAVQIADISDTYALIAIQGPRSAEILAGTHEAHIPGLAELGYYASTAGQFTDTPLLVARTGYTGEDGFELLIATDRAVQLWDALLTAGKPKGLVPAGLAARDTLRLEAGMPLYGHELSLDVMPAQVGLGRVVVASKDDFVGKAGVTGVASPHAPVLVGLMSEGRRAGRAGYTVLDSDGTDAAAVGEITSGALSPSLGHPIAMALVAPTHCDPDTRLFIDVRGTRIPATVTALPFYRRNS